MVLERVSAIIALAGVLVVLPACRGGSDGAGAGAARGDTPAMQDGGGDRWAKERERMVQSQLTPSRRGISDERVLEAMRTTPRHEFVPEELVHGPDGIRVPLDSLPTEDQAALAGTGVRVRRQAYNDTALEIGWRQTISQPYIVAFMTEQLDPQPTDVVLEVGTGSGYQAAVLSSLVEHVYSIEIVEPLARRAEALLDRLGYDNVTVRYGDGYQGWEEHAPFDAIIVTCAPDSPPDPLIAQLKDGGCMVIPTGDLLRGQYLWRLERHGDEIFRQRLMPVSFVPMTGEAEEPEGH